MEKQLDKLMQLMEESYLLCRAIEGLKEADSQIIKVGIQAIYHEVALIKEILVSPLDIYQE